MSTNAKEARFKRELALLEKSRRPQPDAVKLAPRRKIRIRLRCRLCGRARGVYRKFGICRICFRSMASQGLIPGVKKASW
jgi:ribosomal protein S14